MIICGKKENLPFNRLWHLREPQSKNQRKWQKRQVLRPCQRTKKVVKYEGDGDTNYNWRIWNSFQRLVIRVNSSWNDDNQSDEREKTFSNSLAGSVTNSKNLLFDLFSVNVLFRLKEILMHLLSCLSIISSIYTNVNVKKQNRNIGVTKQTKM